MARKLNCRRIVLLWFLVILCVPATAQGATFDYRNYESLLKRHANPGVTIDGIALTAVNYAAFVKEAEKKDSDYSGLLSQLSSFNPDRLETREEKMAFWINVYNIAAIKTIVDDYPVDSIRSRKIHWLGLPWNRKVITVGGKEYSLGEIEHDILLDTYKDLRIHFAINCASVSCVDLLLEPYHGSALFRQLDEQARRFLADSQRGFRIGREERTVYLSQVFKFDKERFDTLGGGALHFILPFLGSEGREFIRKEKPTMKYLGYNWKSNDLKHAK